MPRFTPKYSTELSDEELRQRAGLSRRADAEASPLGSMLKGSALGLGGTVQSSLGNVAGVLGADETSRALYTRGAGLSQAAGELTPTEASWANVNDPTSFAKFVGLNAAAAPITSAPALAGAALFRGAPLLGAGLGSGVPLHGENVQTLNADPALAGMSEGEKLLRAGGAALPQAALDAVVPASFVSGATGRLVKNLAPGIRPVVRGTAAVAGTSAIEGGTELGQEYLKQGMHTLANPARDKSQDSADLMQSFAAGAAGGLGFGAGESLHAAHGGAPDAKPGRRLRQDLLGGRDGVGTFDAFMEHLTGERKTPKNYDAPVPPEVFDQGPGAVMDYTAQNRDAFMADVAASTGLSDELKARVTAGDPAAESEAKAQLTAISAADTVRSTLGALAGSVRRHYGAKTSGRASLDSGGAELTTSPAITEMAKNALAQHFGINYGTSAPGIDEQLGSMWDELRPLVQARFMKPNGSLRIPEDIIQSLGGQQAADDLLVALSDATYGSFAERSAARVALRASNRARSGTLSALRDVVAQHLTPEAQAGGGVQRITEQLAAVLDHGITRQNRAQVDAALKPLFGNRTEALLESAEQVLMPRRLEGQLGGAEVSKDEFALHQADDLDRLQALGDEGAPRRGNSDDAAETKQYDDVAAEVHSTGTRRTFVPPLKIVTNRDGSTSRLRDRGENRDAVRQLIELQERHPDLDVQLSTLYDAAEGDLARVLDLMPEAEAESWSRRMQQGSPAQQKALPGLLAEEARTRYAVTAKPRPDDIGRMQGDIGVFTQADLARVAMDRIGQKGANKNSVDNPLVTGEHTALWVKLKDGVRMPSTRVEADEQAADGKAVKGESGIMTQREEDGATWLRVSGQNLWALAQERMNGQGRKGRAGATEAWAAGMSALLTSEFVDAEAGIRQVAPTQNEKGDMVGAKVKGTDGRTRFRLQPAQLDASYNIIGGKAAENGEKVAAAEAQRNATKKTRSEFDKLPMRDPAKPTMTYAGIGSRETPPAALEAMTRLAQRLQGYGYTLRSGGAKGADRAFANGAGGSKEVFLKEDATDLTRAIAREVHPAPDRLSPVALDLMARNTNQIFGAELDTPADFVLTWTPDGIETAQERSFTTGGTGQAIEMAHRKGIPIINMAKKGWAKRLELAVQGKLDPAQPPVTPLHRWTADVRDLDTVAADLATANDELDAAEAAARRKGAFGTEKSDPKTPTATMAMKFADGSTYGGVRLTMRPEFRGKSTLALIRSGDRTATTRRGRPNVRGGELIRMEGSDGARIDVRVTKEPYQLQWFDDPTRDSANAEKWSKLEGWAPEVFESFARQRAWQFQYARAETAGLPTAPSRPNAKELERALAKVDRARRKVEFLTREFDSINAEETTRTEEGRAFVTDDFGNYRRVPRDNASGPVERMAFGDEQQTRAQASATTTRTVRTVVDAETGQEYSITAHEIRPLSENEEMAEAAQAKLDRTERMVDETTGEELISTVPRQELLSTPSREQRAADKAEQAERNAQSAMRDAKSTEDQAAAAAHTARQAKVRNALRELEAAVAAPSAFVVDDTSDTTHLGERAALAMYHMTQLVGRAQALEVLQAAFDQTRLDTEVKPSIFTSFKTAPQALRALEALSRRIDALKVGPQARRKAHEQKGVVMANLLGSQRDLAKARDEMEALAVLLNRLEGAQLTDAQAAALVARDAERSEQRIERSDEEAATSLEITPLTATRVYSALLDAFNAVDATDAAARLTERADTLSMASPEGLDILARARQYLARRIQHHAAENVGPEGGEGAAGRASKDSFGETTKSEATDEQRAQAQEAVAKLVSMDVVWKKLINDNPAIAGFYRMYKDGRSQLELAVHAANPLTVAFHESMHAFFDWASKSDDAAVRSMYATLSRVVMSPVVARQLQAHFADRGRTDDAGRVHNLVLTAMNLDARAVELSPGSKAYDDMLHERMAYYFQLYANGDVQPLTAAASMLDRVVNFLRSLVGLLSDEQKYDRVLAAFAEGRMSTPSAMAATYRSIEAREKALNRLWDATAPARRALEPWVLPNINTLSRMKNANIDWIQRQFYNEVSDTDRELGLLQAKEMANNKFFARWRSALGDVTADEQQAIYDILIAAEKDGVKKTGVERIDTAVEHTLAMLEELWRYQTKAGVKRLVVGADGEKSWIGVGFRQNYFPRVWDFSKVGANKDKFIAMLLQDKYKAALEVRRSMFEGGDTMTLEQIAEQLYGQMSSTDSQALDIDTPADKNASKVALKEDESRLGYTPWAQHVNVRSMGFIDAADFKEFFNTDLINVMGTYVRQATHKAEYVRRFGHDGGRLRQRMTVAMRQRAVGHYLQGQGLTGAQWEGKGEEERAALKSTPEFVAAEDEAAKDMREVARAVMAMEGTLGHDISPLLRKTLGGVMVYQSVRLMAMSLFANMMDIAGIVARTGEMKDAWGAFKRGMREIATQYKGESGKDDVARILEQVGAVEMSTVMSSLGDAYTSEWLQGSLRRVSDKLFEWNGMTAWNRGQRIYAGETALRDLPKLAKRASQGDAQARRQLEEVGLRPSDRVVVKGELDLTNPKVQEAVVRWVNGAVLRPNAAHRPAKGSDPHTAVLYQFKQFTYSFSKTILKRMAHEHKMGNRAPVYQFAAIALPVILAADMSRALLVHGGDLPGYMQGWGPGEMLAHAVNRSGMLGYGQFGVDAAEDGGFGGLLGPSVDQLVDAVTEDPWKTTVKALPLSTVVRPALL